MAAPTKTRNRFTNGRLKKVKKAQSSDNGVLIDHNYDAGHICLTKDGCEQCVPGKDKILHAKKISYDSWRHGLGNTHSRIASMHQVSFRTALIK